MTMTHIEVTHLEEIVGAMEIPCDYSTERACPDLPAKWVMHLKVCCPHVAMQKLACDGCKEQRLMDAFSLECEFCGTVFDHAPDAYRYIEPLERRP